MLHISERLTLYQFFATLFRYPDEQSLAEIRNDMPAVGEILPEDPSPPPFEDTSQLRELQVAYTGLFINRLGGTPAPPYGSVYLEEDQRLIGATTRQAAAAFEAEGLSLEGSEEPADFLATELEFLYFLVAQEETSLKEHDISAARAAGEKQAHFSQQLLLPWVFAFAKRVLNDPESHPLYRWGAHMLIRFMQSEQQWFARRPIDSQRRGLLFPQ